jgi:hypothetical protein
MSEPLLSRDPYIRSEPNHSRDPRQPSEPWMQRGPRYMSEPRRHGDEMPLAAEDAAADWWAEDPDMWYGLTTSMTEYLAWERAVEESGDVQPS